jgi:hypothetical protein
MSVPRTGPLPFLLRAAAVAVVAGVAPALAAPLNDNFVDATWITAFPFSDSVDTLEATTEATDPYSSCDAGGNGHSVWYAGIAPDVLDVVFSTAGSEYDTVVSVWTMDEWGTLTEVGCNDDSGGLTSLVPFTTEAEETYYFMVGAYGTGSGGPLAVSLYEYVPPPPFEISGTLDRARTYMRTDSGSAWGTVTCSEDGWYYVYGQLYQETGRRFITRVYFSGSGECTEGTMDWVAPLDLWDGFLVGRATYTLSVYGYSMTTGVYGSSWSEGTIVVGSGSGR